MSTLQFSTRFNLRVLKSALVLFIRLVRSHFTVLLCNMDASILLVSVTSLATYAGVIDDGQSDRPDVEKSRFLKVQVSSTY